MKLYYRKDRAVSIEKNKQKGFQRIFIVIKIGSDVICDKVIFENLENNKRDISLSDKKRKN